MSDEQGTSWVLVEELASKKARRYVYFRAMTAIGPCATTDVERAAKFNSQQEARMSPAYVHILSCYEPYDLSDKPVDSATSKSSDVGTTSLPAGKRHRRRKGSKP